MQAENLNIKNRIYIKIFVNFSMLKKSIERKKESKLTQTKHKQSFKYISKNR